MRNLISVMMLFSLLSLQAAVSINAKITSDDGNAITNAAFHIQYYDGRDAMKEMDTSDRSGMAHIDLRSSRTSDYDYWADAPGYYRSTWKSQHIRFAELFYPFYHIKYLDNQLNNEVVLRTIKNPIPMDVASFPSGKRFPKLDDEVFFDLEKMDWLPPYGHGAIGDVKLKCRADVEKDRYEGTELVFVGRGCGAVIVPLDKSSVFKSPYHADPLDDYKNVCYFNDTTEKMYGDGCLIARVRVEFDDKGEIISSHYVKIYELSLWGELKTTGIYFNPIPNDTNLECDVRLSNNKSSYAISP